MTVRDFVRQTLVEIADGMREAQDAEDRHENRRLKINDGAREPQMIEFDLAVTIDESASGNAGAALSVASVFKLGGGGEIARASQVANRVRFSVPCWMPFDGQRRSTPSGA